MSINKFRKGDLVLLVNLEDHKNLNLNGTTHIVSACRTDTSGQNWVYYLEGNPLGEHTYIYESKLQLVRRDQTKLVSTYIVHQINEDATKYPTTLLTTITAESDKNAYAIFFKHFKGKQGQILTNWKLPLMFDDTPIEITTMVLSRPIVD